MADSSLGPPPTPDRIARYRLTGRAIVCLSSIDWHFNWQGHQEIMSWLAEAGNRVLFVENTGVRVPGPRDWPRLRARLANRRRGTRGFRVEPPGVTVYAPLLVPLPYSRLARGVNRALLLRAIRGWLRAITGDRPLIWTFLPTPLALDVCGALDPALTIYYCIDDLATSSRGARQLASSEARMLREVDLVFVTTGSLAARARRFRREVHVFPFGVSLEQFATPRLRDGAPANDLAGIPRPRAGYVGSVSRKLDQDLLATVAGLMPDVSFVLVGAVEEDAARIRRQPNVHCLGPRPHGDVPRYLRGFDLGIIPYRRDEYTAHIYPAKLNEYLAAGLPVVATDLAELRLFNERHGPVVHLCADAAAFVEATRKAVRETSPAEVARRHAVARTNDWGPRINEMMGVVAVALDRRRRDHGGPPGSAPAASCDVRPAAGRVGGRSARPVIRPASTAGAPTGRQEGEHEPE